MKLNSLWVCVFVEVGRVNGCVYLDIEIYEFGVWFKLVGEFVFGCEEWLGWRKFKVRYVVDLDGVVEYECFVVLMLIVVNVRVMVDDEVGNI